MKPLSGLDGAFLHLETPETPMHVGVAAPVRPAARLPGDFHAAVKRLMTRRLPLAPAFRRKLAPMPLQFANPVWIRDDKPDMAYHVQRVTLPPPGTQVQLEDLTGRLHSELLDRSRPLWRLYVIDGLAERARPATTSRSTTPCSTARPACCWRRRCSTSRRGRAPCRGRAAGRRPAEQPGMIELAAAALKHDVGQYIKLLRHLPEVAQTLAGLLGGRSGPRCRPAGPELQLRPAHAAERADHR